MAAEARHHHFIPQSYLRGFSTRAGKKPRITVGALQGRRFFETTPRNVGGARDFNRIDATGVKPDMLEGFWSKLEGEAAAAIRAVDETGRFEEPHRTTILTLMSLLAVRHPAMRENWRTFQEQIAKQIMSLSLATKERWESSVEQMKRDGVQLPGGVTYEQMKEFHDGGEYSIDVPRERHIELELHGMNVVLPLLLKRRWSLFRSLDPGASFITSDRPVCLTWRHSDKVPPIHRQSPGFGMADTEVLFPLSRHSVIAGTFDQPEIVVDSPVVGVANANTKVLMFADQQVYCSSQKFPYFGKDGQVYNDSHLFDRVGT